MGHTVAIIEREDHLGGHVNTYTAASGATLDYGVIIFADVSVTRSYFDYLGVSAEVWPGFTPNATTLYADFNFSAALSPTELELGNVTAQTAHYMALLQQYDALTQGTGFYDLTNPVPDDLLQPWGHWVANHSVPGVAYNAFYRTPGNVLEQPTLYMLKYFDQLEYLSPVLTIEGGNQRLYDAALDKLGNGTNVYLNSRVSNISRYSDRVIVTLNSSHRGSTPMTIRAQQLVLAISATISTLEPFLDLRQQETHLFARFSNLYLWAAILTDTGIPHTIGINNVVPDTLANIPALPACISITPSGIPSADIRAIWYMSTTPLSVPEVKAGILQAVANATRAYNYTSPTADGPRILELRGHSPYLLTVSTHDIRGGFYGRLNALQGQTRTWTTGAARESHDSAAIWNFTEYRVLPGLVQALREA